MTEHPEYTTEESKSIKLVLMGGVRNDGDAARVKSLRALAADLGLAVSSCWLL